MDVSVHSNEPSSGPNLEGFMELSLDLFCVAGVDGVFRWLSPRWTEVLGWSVAELCASPFVEFVHPQDRAATLDELSRLNAGATSLCFENRYRCRDGSYRWLEWSARPHGELVYATARDVTSLRERREERDERARFLELAEELAHVGHWRVDLEEESVFWSDEVYRIHGRAPGSFVPSLGEGVEAYHPEDREAVWEAVAAAVERGESFDIVRRLIRDDGELRYIRSVGRPEHAPDGKIVAIFGVFQDVTEAHVLQERLLQSERMASVGTLAGGVAHEINNPLAFVMANLEVIEEELLDLDATADVRELVQAVREARSGAARVRRIVRGLKSFSRVEPPKTEPVNVAQVLKSAIEMAHNEIRHRATLIREIGSMPRVVGDDQRLSQALLNVLVNAAQALPEGGAQDGRIAIRAGAVPGGVSIEVSDNGCGMSRDVARRALEPFFTTRPVGLGSGLGLSIAHGIVESFGGRIELDSVEGGGTTVSIWLPAVEVATSKGAGRSEHEALARVLVVDDEEFVREAVRRLLRKVASVVAVESGIAALDLLESDADFDVVLCDLMMPRMSGMDLERELRLRHAELADRMVFISGGAFSDGAATFLDETEQPVLEKPFDGASLRELVADVARRS